MSIEEKYGKPYSTLKALRWGQGNGARADYKKKMEKKMIALKSIYLKAYICSMETFAKRYVCVDMLLFRR